MLYYAMVAKTKLMDKKRSAKTSCKWLNVLRAREARQNLFQQSVAACTHTIRRGHFFVIE